MICESLNLLNGRTGASVPGVAALGGLGAASGDAVARGRAAVVGLACAGGAVGVLGETDIGWQAADRRARPARHRREKRRIISHSDPKRRARWLAAWPEG